MVGNNLSTLGVSAAQIDNKLDTQSLSLAWMPTTGEFGLWNTFGDYDDHQKVATRIGVHYTHSVEEKQSQPGTEGIENSQIRLTDGSIVFTPDLFGPGIAVNTVDYHMTSIDAGVKYKGMSLEGELLALAEQLHRRQHQRHCQHQRQWLSAADLGDGRSQGSSAVLRSLASVRPLRRPVGSARRRELVPDEGARDSPQRRVDVREPITRRIHGLSLPGGGQGRGVPHQPRAELLIDRPHLFQ
jgi:hypothetical protein